MTSGSLGYGILLCQSVDVLAIVSTALDFAVMTHFLVVEQQYSVGWGFEWHSLYKSPII